MFRTSSVDVTNKRDCFSYKQPIKFSSIVNTYPYPSSKEICASTRLAFCSISNGEIDEPAT